MASIDDIIRRKYTNFRGVDFSENNNSLYRSPLSINMWKDYSDSDCIQTRPGMKLLGTFNNRIYGLFFYKINNTIHVLVHNGTRLVRWSNYPNTPVSEAVLKTNMNIAESKAFVMNNKLYILDGTNYLVYDGETCSDVVGTIPVTSYYRTPSGESSLDETTDTDTVLQPVNVLQSKRKNMFIGDGTSKTYYLDAKGLDSATVYLMEATVNGTTKTENVDFTVNRTKGTVTFNTAPAKDAEVYITYSITNLANKRRVLNSTLLCEFDNRVFFSGNPDYPGQVFHCELNDPCYVRDTAYYSCGTDASQVKALVPGNNVLWVIKEMNQNSSSVYYMTPTLDSTYDKIYPSVNGSISLGCVSKGINYNDDIVFFSNRGLEGISNSSMYSEQILQHRSSTVDSKLLASTGYKNVSMAEYNGYLMCLVDSKIYLADSRQKYQSNSNEIEYEWYYWEMPNSITYLKEYRGELFLANASGSIYKLDGTTDNGTAITSIWTTAKDDFGYPGYTKTTNKKGDTATVKVLGNDSIHVDTIVDGTLKEKKVLSDTKGYIVFKIKDKKFKNIQIKFSSNKPFGLFSCTLEGFIAGYLKR